MISSIRGVIIILYGVSSRLGTQYLLGAAGEV